MPVTADSLFHFTPSLKSLKDILYTKFRLTYCKEKYTISYQEHDSYYPMISFCDIPLSLVKDQIQKYGSYGIGMSKEWAIKNNLNPVVYIEKNSLLAADIQATFPNMGELINNTAKFRQDEPGYIKNKSSRVSSKIHEIVRTINEIKALDKDSINIKKTLLTSAEDILDSFQTELKFHSEQIKIAEEFLNGLEKLANNNLNLFRYIKNYQGVLKRKNKTIGNYRFYDEREWRYIPSITDKRLEPNIDHEKFKKYRGTRKNKPFIKGITLPFDSKDIKYLIVKSNNDITKLVKAIKGNKDLFKKPAEIDILVTKIITTEQLNNDF